MTNVAAAFLAFSSDDSLLVRNAMRDLTALGADAHAIVRLRLGLLTWVDAGRRRGRAAPPYEPPAATCRGLGRDGVHTVGRGFRWKASPRRCRVSVAAPPPSPRSHRLTEALRLLPAGRPAPLSNSGAGLSVPLNRRQAPAVRLGRRRGLRLRVDLRRPRARQVGTDEQPRPRLLPARRPGPPATQCDHRYRTVLGRIDLTDPRSLAAGAPP